MGARLLLAGYFGCGNLGDDAILLGFLEGLKGSDYEVRALTGSVGVLMRDYGVTGVPRMEMGTVKEAIQECDALVFPGGSIFQDASSVRSVAYYSNLVSMAKKAKKKVILLGQGVGPLDSWLGKRFAKGAFAAADVIAVRDPASAQTLKALGVNQTPRITADLAFLLPVPPATEDEGQFGIAGMKSVGISVRPWGKDRNKGVIKVFGEVARALYERGYVPVMIEADRNMDSAVIQEIAKAQGGKIPEVKGLNGPIQLQQRLARLQGVIAMRLHVGILAASVKVPPFMVSYDPKVTAFASALGYPAPPTMQNLTAARIVEGFSTFIKDRDRNAAALEPRRQALAEQALQNVEILRQVMAK